MTDRTNFLTVVLDGDYRDDDVQAIIDAISMIKGILSVKINVADPHEYMAIERAKNDLKSKIIKELF